MESIRTYVFEEQSSLQTEKHGVTNANFPFDVSNLFDLKNNNKPQYIWNLVATAVEHAIEEKLNKILLIKNRQVLEGVLNIDIFLEIITESVLYNTRVLFGNICADDVTLIPVSKNLAWTDSVNGFELVVINECCFDLILENDYLPQTTLDEGLELLTSNKMLLYPMIDKLIVDDNYKAVKIRMDRLMNIRNQLITNRTLILGNA